MWHSLGSNAEKPKRSMLPEKVDLHTDRSPHTEWIQVPFPRLSPHTGPLSSPPLSCLHRHHCHAPPLAAATAAPLPLPPSLPCSIATLFYVVVLLLSSMEISSVYRVSKYYSNVEYPSHQPQAKFNFCVRSLMFFWSTAHIFGTACKNWPDILRLNVTPPRHHPN